MEFQGPIPSLEVPKGNLISYIFQESHRWSDLPAMICGLTDRTWTFAQFQQQMGRWGTWLIQRWGHFVPQQTVVGILSAPSVEFALAQLGTMAVGGAFVFLYTSFTPYELAQQILDSETSLIVAQVEFESTLGKTFDILGKRIPLVVIGSPDLAGLGSFSDIVCDEDIVPIPPAKLTGDERSILLYTSGSTGLPKCVIQTHYQVAVSVAMMLHPRYCLIQPTINGVQTRHLTNRQFGLVFSFLCCLLPSLKLGVCQIVKPLDEVTLPLDMINYKIHHMAIVPPSVPALLAAVRTSPSVLDHLRGLVISGAPLPDVFADAVATTLPGVMLKRCYGLTECLVIAVDPVTGGKPGYTGQLVPGVRARVADVNTGELLPAGRDGLIYVHSPCAMTCYLNNEAATAEILDSDGWINTGDVGHVDEDGFLRITDRIKELIKIKDAVSVSPSEIENSVLSDARVLEACVVGIPSPLSGLDIFQAFVVVKKCKQESKSEKESCYAQNLDAISEKGIKEALREKLCEDKIPHAIIFLEEMPKNVNGKTDRFLLKKKVADMAQH